MTATHAVLCVWFLCYLPLTMFTGLLFSPTHPLAYSFHFKITHSSRSEFNLTAATNVDNDGTNSFQYSYILYLNITVQKTNKYDQFMHYDNVKVMGFYRGKTFDVVDLNSFYLGKQLSSTTDLLSLTHTFRGQYDLVIDPVAVDEKDLKLDNIGIFPCHGNATNVDSNIVDVMVARVSYSMAPPKNTTWPYKTNYTKEELEYKCELELKFPLINEQEAAQRTLTNGSSSLMTSQCYANFIKPSCLLESNLYGILEGCVFIPYLGVFYKILKRLEREESDDRTIQDSLPLQETLLENSI